MNIRFITAVLVIGWMIPTITSAERFNLEPDVYVEGQVLVKFESGENNDVATIASSVGAREIEYIESIGYSMLESDTKSTQELIDALSGLRSVEAAQPNYIYTTQSQIVPWGLAEDGVRAAAEVHATKYTGEGITVAVVDTGIYQDHEDLNDNIWNPVNGDCQVDGEDKNCIYGGWDFVNDDNNPVDDQGHGTHVAGTVAAEDNQTGVVGVAPNATLMAVKVLDSGGSGTTADIASGIDFARTNGADVVNMSIGASSYDEALEDAVDNAWDSGLVVISAAGNESMQEISYPAGFEHSISVGAIQQSSDLLNPDEDMNTRLAYFSNYGSVDVVAPGMRINSTVCNCGSYDGTYSGDYWAGTSMATPHVAGVAALLLEANSNFTPAQVKHRLEATATDLGEPGRDQYFGSGLVNAAEGTKQLTDSIVVITNYESSNDGTAPTVYLPQSPADGVSTTPIQVKVMDETGTFVSGALVNATTTLGTLVAASVTTDADGIATFTLTAPATEGTATLTVASDYGTASTTVAFSNILLVSDTAEWYYANSLAWWTTRALLDNNIAFVRYDTMFAHPTRAQSPTAAYLAKFDEVLWQQGELYLSDANQSLLKTVMDNGDSVFVSGQDELYYVENAQVTDVIFSSYLKLAPLADDGSSATYTGDDGGSNITGYDLFTDIAIDLISLSDGAGPYYYSGLLPDYGTLQAGGTAIATYDDASNATAGVKVDSTYQSIFLSFGFESVELRDSRSAMFAQIINFLSAASSISTASVNAGSENAVNEITAPSQSAINVDVTFSAIPSSGYGGVTLTDGEHSVYGSAAVDTTAVVTRVTGIDVSSLNDGPISVYATHTDNPTNFPATTAGVAATKTTGQPTNLAITESKTKKISLTWDAPSTQPDSYTVHYGTDINASNVGTKSVTSTNATLSNLKPGKRYYVTVSSTTDNAVSSVPEIISQMTLFKKPTHVKFKKRTAKAVTLRWKATANQFDISYGTNKNAGNLGTILSTTKRKKISSLKSNTRYYFKTAIHNSLGTLNYSKKKSGFTAPSKVANQRVRNVTSTAATVSYKKVRRKITKYVIQLRDQTGQTSTFITTDLSIGITGLTPRSTYTVKTRAIRAALGKTLKGRWSNPNTFTTP